MQVDDFLKKFRLLSRYYLHSLYRTMRFGCSPLFFGVSLFLFSLILFPNLGRLIIESRLIPQIPIRFEVSGIVLKEEINSITKIVEQIPVSHAEVEVGGFRTMTEKDGSYLLNFLSPDTQSIKIVFSSNEYRLVEELSFPKGATSTVKDIIIK